MFTLFFSELPSSVSLAILSTYRRIRRLLLLCSIALYLFANVIMYVHVLFINAVYRVSLRDALLWVVFFPLHVFYVFYGKELIGWLVGWY